MSLPNFELYEFSKRKDMRVLLLGATGMGKTYFAKKLLRYLQQQRNKILVMDAKNEFNFKKLTYHEIGVWDRSICKMSESYEINGKKIDNPVLISEYMSALGWYFAPVVLYYEEIVEYLGKNDNLPISHPFFYKCLQQGRAKGIRMIFATQMIAQTNLALLRQSTDVFIFRMRKEELRRLENLLSLDKNTLNFTGREDDYRFYHLNAIDSPKKYEKLDFVRRGRKKASEK